ncbi:hypothetical protein WJX81_008011 [Elliptochloris bilobata]|uniref:Uncharacterized protein n=1 Tax=Elliptochloris bilobata TaxID=381761 RepID=A0AAW1S4G4_9CHLO
MTDGPPPVLSGAFEELLGAAAKVVSAGTQAAVLDLQSSRAQFAAACESSLHALEAQELRAEALATLACLKPIDA